MKSARHLPRHDQLALRHTAIMHIISLAPNEDEDLSIFLQQIMLTLWEEPNMIVEGQPPQQETISGGYLPPR